MLSLRRKGPRKLNCPDESDTRYHLLHVRRIPSLGPFGISVVVSADMQNLCKTEKNAKRTVTVKGLLDHLLLGKCVR